MGHGTQASAGQPLQHEERTPGRGTDHATTGSLRILYFLFGYAIIALGLFLLIFSIANAALLTLF